VSVILLSSLESNCAADDISLDSATTATNNTDKVQSLSLSSASSSSKLMNSDRTSTGRIPRLIRDSVRAQEDTSISRSDSSRIRTRYLSRLGVGASKVAPMPACVQNRRDPAVGVLKKHKQEAEPAKARVSFKASVSVHWIPNRNTYKDRDAIWTQKDDFRKSAERNSVEFAADGWDWRQATEESDFICCQDELIHPAHFRACNLQRQFLMIRYAQQREG
jgi:hypothetical protein